MQYNYYSNILLIRGIDFHMLEQKFKIKTINIQIYGEF